MNTKDVLALALQALEKLAEHGAYSLSIAEPAIAAIKQAQQAQEPVAPEQVEAAWRAGWAACRDAEYVGQEAEDEAWGMSQTCANADWENAAPKQAEQEGYTLVPIVATPEMMAAGDEVEDLYRRGTPETWGKVYRAMIAAAPTPPEAA